MAGTQKISKAWHLLWVIVLMIHPASVVQAQDGERSSGTGEGVQVLAQNDDGSVPEKQQATGWMVRTSEPPPDDDSEVLRDQPPRVAVAQFRPGSGIFLMSEDGRFALQAGIRGQLLATLRDADNQDLEQSLELRRGRVVLSGHTFGKHNRFRIQLHFSPRDMRVDDTGAPRLTPLRDFILTFDYLRDFTLRVGQYKVPFSRERVISSGKLQLVDRSIVNREFTVDRDVGFDIRSEDLGGLGMFRYYAGFYMGEGAGSFQPREPGYMYLARFEVLPLGMFNDYTEGATIPTETPRLSFGAGVAHIQDVRNNRGITGTPLLDGGTSKTTHAAFDGLFKAAGFSLQIEALLRWVERDPGTEPISPGGPVIVEAPREGWGVMTQVGQRLPVDGLEVAARYSTILPFDDERSSLPEQNELGGGLSWYIEQHSFKIQADYFWLWGEQGFDFGTHQARLQLQLSL